MSASSRVPRSRVLPVAEIFSVERVESIGAEAIVTVVIGDAEHTPHVHGLRAPESRWVEIVRALAADPSMALKFAAAIANPGPVIAPARNSGAPVRLGDDSIEATHSYAPLGDRSPGEDPASAFYRRPVTKPNGGLL